MERESPSISTAVGTHSSNSRGPSSPGKITLPKDHMHTVLFLTHQALTTEPQDRVLLVGIFSLCQYLSAMKRLTNI